jgi:hypothetical protein
MQKLVYSSLSIIERVDPRKGFQQLIFTHLIREPVGLDGCFGLNVQCLLVYYRTSQLTTVD